MSDQEKIAIIHLRSPIQCVLWEHPDRLKDKFGEFFDEVETYEDSSHLTRTLYKCRECGQLYFFEWYEWVDWLDGNDKSYSSLVPVHTQEEIEAVICFPSCATFRAYSGTAGNEAGTGRIDQTAAQTVPRRLFYAPIFGRRLSR